MDEDMEQLVESIKRNGVMTPATVRLKEDGRYELISGHRRKKACELAGLETLKCEVKELTRDEAIIVMVEVISNAPLFYQVKKPLRIKCGLIACPIGVKSKSKSLFLVSINSPPCICKNATIIFYRNVSSYRTI